MRYDAGLKWVVGDWRMVEGVSVVEVRGIVRDSREDPKRRYRPTDFDYILSTVRGSRVAPAETEIEYLYRDNQITRYRLMDIQ